MEKVVVVKRMPGILEVGDILTSGGFGQDFILEQRSSDKFGSQERYVNLDYYTVSDNIPNYFQFYVDGLFEEYNTVTRFDEIVQSPEDIHKRYNYFVEQMNNAPVGSEQHVVYTNLVWLLEWLIGSKELVRN